MQEKKITLKSLDTKFEQKFDAVDVRFSTIDKRFSAIDTRFDAMDVRFDVLEESIRRIGLLMEEINGKLSLLLEGYMGHDTRIVSLESWREKIGESLE